MLTAIIGLLCLIFTDLDSVAAHSQKELEPEYYFEDSRGMELIPELDLPLHGSAPLFNIPFNMGYTANIYIGSSRQAFKVVIDTGSAVLWVPSVDCESEGCKRHIRYNPIMSSNASSTGRVFDIRYGTGTVAGYIFHDKIEVAGMELPSHPVGAAIKESSYFTDKPFDGIFGLAFCNLSPICKKSILDSLKENGLIRRKRFALFLSIDGGRPSELLFDNVHSEYSNANWTCVPLSSAEGFWMVKLDSVEIIVNGTKSLIYFSQNQAIMDTGSTLIYAPYNAAKALHKRIPGARKLWFRNYYTFPCTSVANLTLNFIIGGLAMRIAPENLSLGSDDGGNTCFSAIVGSAGNEWVLGSAFLRNVYTLWDADNRTISFTKLK